jgi:hypothetical protein
MILTKKIVYFGKTVVLVCDGKCEKAFGGSVRPKGYPDDKRDEDDWYWVADDEVGEAPKHPGTIEGTHIKPQHPDDRLNKWCARECERSQMCDLGTQLKVRTFTGRVYNYFDREKRNEN